MSKLKAARTRRLMVAGLAAFALVAASCSDDDGGSSDTTAGEETTTTVADDALGEPNPASGEPVVVSLINEEGGDSNAQSLNTHAGIDIAVAYVNEYLGGLNGRPIEILHCAGKGTPADNQACATEAVQAGVAFYTQPYQAQEEIVVNTFAEAGIPSILNSSSSGPGMTGPHAYALTGGYPGTLGLFALAAKEAGVTKLAHMVTDVPAATGAAKALGGITFGNAGVGYEVVAVPLATPDFSATMQTAVTGGADALMATGDASFCSSFFKAYKALGLDLKKFVISVCVTDSVIQEAGDVLAGSYSQAAKNPSAEEAAIYAAAVAKYGADDIDPDPAKSSSVSDGFSVIMNVWAAFQGYTGAFDPTSIEAHLAGIVDVPLYFSGGGTATCDGKAIPIVKNVCSGSGLVGIVDAAGVFSDVKEYNAAEAYATPAG